MPMHLGTFSVGVPQKSALALLLLALSVDASAAQINVPVLRATEELRISGHKESLVHPVWVRVLADQTIAVNQEDDQAIRLYSPAGKLLKTIGRKGRGPGEFLQLREAGLLGDTLWVYDRSGSRLSLIFPPFTEVVHRTVGWGRNGEYPVGLLSGGDAIVSDPSGWRRVSSTGARKGGLVPKPAWREPVPLADQQWGHAGPDGLRAVTATTEINGKGEGTVRLTGLDLLKGDTVFRKEFVIQAERIPPRVRDSAAKIQPAPPAASGARSIPSFYPLIKWLDVDGEGRTWLAVDSSDRRARTQCVLFDAKGNAVGRMSLPPRSFFEFARGDRVWVLEFDADDVPSIVRYRFGKEVLAPGRSLARAWREPRSSSW